MGHEFSVTPKMKGGLGETLLTAHKSAIRDYFTEWCLEDLRENNSEWLPAGEFHHRFDTRRPPRSYDLTIDGAHATWKPDALYEIRFTPPNQFGEDPDFEPYSVQFPIEVKTGRSSELTDNQRAVMATIAAQPDPIVPVRIRVDVSDLPETFDVTATRIGDGSLPSYETDQPDPPGETTVPDAVHAAMAVVSGDDGFTTQDLADELGIARETAETYLDTLASRGEVYSPEDDWWRPI